VRHSHSVLQCVPECGITPYTMLQHVAKVAFEFVRDNSPGLIEKWLVSLFVTTRQNS